MTAIDLFSGCGGLSTGLRKAGFEIIAAVENEEWAAKTYRLNHPETEVIEKNIQDVTSNELKALLGGRELDLLAGCPPCQGFSSIRRHNKRRSVQDSRNRLILQFVRFARELKPKTLLMENVSWLQSYYLFKRLMNELSSLGYKIDSDVVNAKDFGVPQNRKRLVVVGSLNSEISVAKPTMESKTVRDAIQSLPSVSATDDRIHKIHAGNRTAIKEMIKLIPKNGGSRKDLPEEYILACHRVHGVGFNDVYGRLGWDVVAGTITGGCLNPSKGRFLHPTENRGITAREAALLQSFPKTYKFPEGISKTRIALLIGNAFPPQLSYHQGKAIMSLLSQQT